MFLLLYWVSVVGWISVLMLSWMFSWLLFYRFLSLLSWGVSVICWLLIFSFRVVVVSWLCGVVRVWWMVV